MPIPARLSRRLYETFGDDAGADMVNWMQQVDAQRAELRELNELNYARLDARFGQFDARIGELDARMGQLEARLGQFQAGIVGRLEARIEQRTADLMKWSFVFWVGAVAAVAVLAGVLRESRSPPRGRPRAALAWRPAPPTDQPPRASRSAAALSLSFAQIAISTRRFCARPAAVSLPATGCISP